jgi:hypothetical protein
MMRRCAQEAVPLNFLDLQRQLGAGTIEIKSRPRELTQLGNGHTAIGKTTAQHGCQQRATPDNQGGRTINQGGWVDHGRAPLQPRTTGQCGISSGSANLPPAAELCRLRSFRATESGCFGIWHAPC